MELFIFEWLLDHLLKLLGECKRCMVVAGPAAAASFKSMFFMHMYK